MVINGYYQQIITGYQWLSKVLNGYKFYQCLLVINKLLLVINGNQGLLMVIKSY